MEKISNIKQLLNDIYEKYKMNIAYQKDDKEITYKDFIEEINCLGTKLNSLGLYNKKIGILSENRYEWELAFLSIICGTGVAVPIDKSLPKSEIERIINRADIKVVFSSDKYIDNIENVEYIISMDSDISKNNVLSLKELIKQGKELLNNGNMDFINNQISDEELAVIFFTSGTTDESKAVMLSHKNICASLTGTKQVLNLNQNDRVLSVLPLNHVLEGLFSFLLSISCGAKRIHCNEINNITDYMKKFNITFMANVPAVYEIIYDSIDDEIAKNFNFLFSGGAYLNTEIIKKYAEKNIKLIQGYGMTENSPVITLENSTNSKIGSCGKVIPNIEMKLLSINEEQIGEIAVKGDTVMIGYLNNDIETKKAIQDGWLLTGDLAKIDEDGYVFICGRNKDLIVLENGKKIFPEEIEEKINNIDNVKESIVFGKENKVCAKIVSDDSEEIIWEKIEKINEELPDYKKVRKIYVSKEKLERTLSGKIKRNEEKISIDKSDNEISYINNSAEKIIKEIIAKQLDVEIDKVNDDANIAKDLMADSLDKLGIILNIEKATNIKIPKEKYEELICVKDFIECLEKYK